MLTAFVCSDSLVVIMSVSDTVVQNQSCHSRETTYPVIDAHAGVCKKVFLIVCSISLNRDQYLFQVGVPFQVNAERPLEEVYADIKEILQG